MDDFKIVMCGCKENGLEMLDYLIHNGVRLSYFVSLNPQQAEKYNVSGYASYEEIAKKYNIPIYYPKEYSLKHKDDISFFNKEKFDLLILGGWQRLIPENILSTLRIGGLGIHGSSDFLPKNRGRSPINWSLIEDKKRYIVQLFLMKPGIDDGDVIVYDMFDINEWDTCKTLYQKLSIVTKRLLAENIPKILMNEIKAIPQKGEATFYQKRTPEDGLIDWSKSVFEIYNFIRALTKPFPGAFTFLNKTKVSIWNAQPFDTRISYLEAVEGEVVEVFRDGEFVVNCNSGTLLVTNCDARIKKGEIFDSDKKFHH